MERIGTFLESSKYDYWILHKKLDLLYPEISVLEYCIPISLSTLSLWLVCCILTQVQSVLKVYMYFFNHTVTLSLSLDCIQLLFHVILTFYVC